MQRPHWTTCAVVAVAFALYGLSYFHVVTKPEALFSVSDALSQFRLWQILSSCFYESSPIKLLGSLVLIAALDAARTETNSKSREFSLYILTMLIVW